MSPPFLSGNDLTNLGEDRGLFTRDINGTVFYQYGGEIAAALKNGEANRFSLTKKCETATFRREDNMTVCFSKTRLRYYLRTYYPDLAKKFETFIALEELKGHKE